ncbi:ATP-dependent DNA helicase [Chloracidobacterium thermophilum]|uniref:DNA 5'-3' helicase n=1 Tax=Chloracidobacterium thermophilum (strain B) TaxID=981222 RepID=G2LE45_CHLTF|nr:helicase C-terminal domain-containing protein [Chloracidobacterium thermophilum]AEP11107.1 Rad3-related DNA helicase [Chloracidobacterium thermophilum B]QUV79024.1 ATP-dependent DNA helicase [Chloracidobacterium thermophilum]
MLLDKSSCDALVCAQSMDRLPLEAVLGPGGLLATTQPGFEFRPGQLEMARAVLDALQRGGHLCVEAGTGTGKTLGYLVPAILCDEVVIVSTATKNLQEQILHHDIPRLERALGRQLRVVLLKGRNNYLCLYRLARFEEQGRLPGLDEVHHLEVIRQWSHTTLTGDRAELSGLPEHLPIWAELDARTERCLGQGCPHYAECFITRARQQAREADIVIVNHHLFFADLAARRSDYGAFLPDYTRVIFDEAHEIEDTAASYFSLQISNEQFAELLRDIAQTFIPDAERARAVRQAYQAVVERAAHFWTFAQKVCRPASQAGNRNRAGSGSDARGMLQASDLATEASGYTALAAALDQLAEALGQAAYQKVGNFGINTDPALLRLESRARQLCERLLRIVQAQDANYVYWWERPSPRRFSLQATPIDIAALLREQLFHQVESVVLTSATLTADGSFAFIRSRLGLDESDELLIDSPFDYKQQARLYLPPDLPDPNHPDFTEAAVNEIIALLDITQGRAFVLCTSLRHMRQLYERVREKVPFPCLIQGDQPRSSLIKTFQAEPGAVLFGAASFWQGVDVVGPALSCVIVDRLPFPVPSDPLVAARCQHIENQSGESGGNAFQSYSLPQAILALKQGFGRLIRSRTDRGILCLLDPRIRTKPYGPAVLRSLPPDLPRTGNRDDLRKWFCNVP